jgi:hypothetical protein
MTLERRLQAPFDEADLEYRVAQSGQTSSGLWVKYFVYVTNRAIQDRLDAVVGATRWRVDFADWRGNSQLCHLALFVDELGEWVTKTDGAGDTDFEPIKGGISNAMKRAAVQWGIGRYLYKLPDAFADVSTSKPTGEGWHFCKVGAANCWWKPKPIPRWALPPVDLENARDMRDVSPHLVPVTDTASAECNYYTLIKTPPHLQGKVDVLGNLVTAWLKVAQTADDLDTVANAISTLQVAKHLPPSAAERMMESVSKAADELAKDKVKQMQMEMVNKPGEG